MTSVLTTNTTSSGTSSIASPSLPQTVGFNEENFLKKLDSVTPTQESIQSLALWIIHHKANHEVICRLWLKKLNESTNDKQRLALFYLANDVIQNCKRKNAKIFQDTFRLSLIDAVESVRSEPIKKKIERVFDVWSERNVYEHEFIVKLIQNLYSKQETLDSKMATRSPPPSTVSTTKSPPNSILLVQHPNETNGKNQIEYQKIISEFQPKKLRETISTFYSLQNEVNLLKTSVEATRLLDISVEHIKQYRDKSQCAKFKVEFENSCAKLEEYIHKLNDESEKRKQLIQLLTQSEIFYDAQFKDATTVYNAYKSYGSKVSLVKRKLDELIINKFNTNDVKLDNLDMEMSEEDEVDDDVKLKKSTKPSSTNYSSSSSKHSSSKLSKSPPSSFNRNNLDPRQNRHSHHHSSSSSNKKSTSSSSSSSKATQSSNKRNKSEEKDGTNTPVKDEHSPIKQLSSSSTSNNPLDFLTKFINKSSTNATNETSSTNSISTSSSSTNLSYLVDSLKKFVNTNTTYNETNTYIPQPVPTNQYMYDSALNSQATYIPQSTSNSIQQQQQQQRSATPTKDEIYQPQSLIQTMPPMPPLPPPLPPLPVDTMHNQPPPGPSSPYLPASYHPMMYSPTPTMYPPPPPMYLQGPPPPSPMQMQQPPPNMPLMMIDPNNCYQYSQSQANTKMIISPTLSNASTNSSSSNLNQPNSPTGNQGYWSNQATPTSSNQYVGYSSTQPQLDDPYTDDNQMRLNNNTVNKRNTYPNDSNQISYKRKYNNNNSNYDDSYSSNYNTNNKSYSKHQQNQRIPTINSQRDRGGSNNSGANSGSNYTDTTINRGNSNNSGRY